MPLQRGDKLDKTNMHRHRLLDAWARGIVVDKVGDGVVERMVGYYAMMDV